jgi:glycosyltransferase involved in cell wall biosynthesis
MFVVAHNGARIWGGAERAIVALLAGLQSRGHRVLLLCNEPLVAAEAAQRGVESTVFEIGGDIALPHALRLASFLRGLKPDAFIIGTYKKLAIGGLGGRLARVPRVVARVGLESDTPRNAKYRFALRHWIDAVAVNAEWIARPFEELKGFGAERVAVIHAGVSAPIVRFATPSLRQSLHLSNDTHVIGTVARLAKQKRIDRLIDAMVLLPDVHCVIAGDGPRRTELERRRDDLNLRDRVHLLGNRDDIAEVLAALDIFIVASDKEGLSNAMLEAMAAGVPIVSTRVSGAEDALSSGAGTIVDFSPRAIAEAVRSMIGDRSMLERMSDAARNRAAGEFSIDRMLDRWERFLAQR